MTKRGDKIFLVKKTVVDSSAILYYTNLKLKLFALSSKRIKISDIRRGKMATLMKNSEFQTEIMFIFFSLIGAFISVAFAWMSSAGF